MNIDEFIEHAKEKAREHRYHADFFESDNPMNKACIKSAEDCEQLAEWLEKSKEYLDLEEQGLLLRLPCKVGDIFYCIAGESVKRIHEMEVLDVNPFGSIYYEDNEIIKIYNIYLDGSIGYLHCRFSDIGKTVFLTKSEAEQKLKEMESSHDGE